MPSLSRFKPGHHAYRLFPAPPVVLGGWTNGMTANRFDLEISDSSGAPGEIKLVTARPNGNWPGVGIITVTLSGGGGGTVSINVPAGSAAPASANFTPTVPGQMALTATNNMGLQNPWPAPYNCFAPSAGTQQPLTISTVTWTDPTGGLVRNRRCYQKDTPSGVPAGFSAVSTLFGTGWGEVWAHINPAGPTTAIHARLYDADSPGATTVVGTGTKIQDTVQVYGAVAAGDRIIRLLLPAGDTRYYLELSTKSDFSNPVRMPQTIYVRHLLALLMRSEEASLCSGWAQGGAPGLTWVTYAKVTGITTTSQGQDTSLTDLPNDWAPADGVSTDLRLADGNMTINSVAMMELGRLFHAKLGHGVSTCGMTNYGGVFANWDDMVGADGAPCHAFQVAIVNQCGGKFRYFHSDLNSWRNVPTMAAGQANMAALVNNITTSYPSCAVISIISRAQYGADAQTAFGASGDTQTGFARLDSYVRDNLEAVNPMVTQSSEYDWNGYARGHADAPSQLRISRGLWRALQAVELPAWGGLGLSVVDRYPALTSTGTISPASIAAGTPTIQIPYTLPAGATALNPAKWYMPGNNAGEFNPFPYQVLEFGDYRGFVYVLPGTHIFGDGASAVAISGASFDGQHFNIALDPSAGVGNIKLFDGTTTTTPSEFRVYFDVNHNLNPYVGPNFGFMSIGVYDNRIGTDGIDSGWHMRPKLDVVVTTV